MPTQDYFPTKDGELLTWLTNHKLKYPNITAQLMLPMESDGELQYEIDLYIQSIHNANTKKEEYQNPLRIRMIWVQRYWQKYARERI